MITMSALGPHGKVAAGISRIETKNKCPKDRYRTDFGFEKV